MNKTDKKKIGKGDEVCVEGGTRKSSIEILNSNQICFFKIFTTGLNDCQRLAPINVSRLNYIKTLIQTHQAAKIKVSTQKAADKKLTFIEKLLGKLKCLGLTKTGKLHNLKS